MHPIWIVSDSLGRIVAGLLALTLPIEVKNCDIKKSRDFHISHHSKLLGHSLTKRAAFARADISETAIFGCRTLGTSYYSNGNSALAE